MATTEEKIELVETLKGPKFYRLTLWGYGGESAYLELTKDQYEYWKEKDEEDYDTTLSYMTGCEDGEYDVDSVPEEMDFMRQVDSDGNPYYNGWYEAPTEFIHQYGVDYSSARITVEEIESAEYSAKTIADVIEGEELQEMLDSVMEEHDYEIELTEMGVAEGCDEQPDYVLQFYSSEKGTFYDGIIETVGPFDIKKLKVYTEEFPNGEDIVVNVTYDGTDIDNQGGDTNGKGYSVHLWTNV